MSSVAVPQHGERVHEDIQLDLHDASDRSLVRVFAVFGANAAGISR